MTVSTEHVGPLPESLEEVSRSLPMDTGSPVPIKVAVAFTTEFVTLGEIDELSIEKPQFIPIFCIMTIETPPHGFGMVDPDGGMLVLQLPLLPVHLHRGMAAAAGEHAFGERRRRNLEFFPGLFGGGGEGVPGQKQKNKDECKSLHHALLNSSIPRRSK
jgi:hypothetical protein